MTNDEVPKYPKKHECPNDDFRNHDARECAGVGLVAQAVRIWRQLTGRIREVPPNSDAAPGSASARSGGFQPPGPRGTHRRLRLQRRLKVPATSVRAPAFGQDFARKPTWTRIGGISRMRSPSGVALRLEGDLSGLTSAATRESQTSVDDSTDRPGAFDGVRGLVDLFEQLVRFGIEFRDLRVDF